MMAKVVKVAIRSFSLYRTGAVMALQGGGRDGVGHDLNQHEQVQLIMAQLRQGVSENKRQHGDLFRP